MENLSELREKYGKVNWLFISIANLYENIDEGKTFMIM